MTLGVLAGVFVGAAAGFSLAVLLTAPPRAPEPCRRCTVLAARWQEAEGRCAALSDALINEGEDRRWLS